MAQKVEWRALLRGFLPTSGTGAVRFTALALALSVGMAVPFLLAVDAPSQVDGSPNFPGAGDAGEAGDGPGSDELEDAGLDPEDLSPGLSGSGSKTSTSTRASSGTQTGGSSSSSSSSGSSSSTSSGPDPESPDGGGGDSGLLPEDLGGADSDGDGIPDAEDVGDLVGSLTQTVTSAAGSATSVTSGLLP